MPRKSLPGSSTRKKTLTGSTSGRRKGGQPGNKNGLRHGFYADLYSIAEGKELVKSLIDDELAIYRFKAHRMAELTPLNGLLAEVTEKEFKMLDHFNNAIISINTLERTRLLARGHGGELADEIWKAIMELNPDDIQ